MVGVQNPQLLEGALQPGVGLAVGVHLALHQQGIANEGPVNAGGRELVVVRMAVGQGDGNRKCSQGVNDGLIHSLDVTLVVGGKLRLRGCAVFIDGDVGAEGSQDHWAHRRVFPTCVSVT